jgi:NAD(P)-dependent dehydrogenase (short-subunit alcohol dehydrogenase family)
MSSGGDHPERLSFGQAVSAAGLITAGAVLSGQAWRRLHGPHFDLVGSTVVITGGSRGLGFELAREFGERGARLALLARTPDELAFAAARLRDRGVDAITVPCDVRDPAQVTHAVGRVIDWSGRVDVLVNNAGVITIAPLDHTPVEDYQQSLQTHFWAPYHMARACLPHMRRLGRGRILNISSIGGRIGVPHLAAYSAGKFALAGWSQALRTALAHEHILVTTATPGLMRTGSHVRAVIRGRHRAEARWFGASMLTPVTSMRAPRAARQIVDACLAGRAHVTPGIQARAAEILQGVAPGAVAWAGALATRLALPHAAPGDAAASVPRRAADVGFGWIEPLLPVDPADRRVRA